MFEGVLPVLRRTDCTSIFCGRVHDRPFLFMDLVLFWIDGASACLRGSFFFAFSSYGC